MKIEDLKEDIVKVLAKYNDAHLAVVGVGYTDEEGNICTHGFTLIRTQPKDHEEELVRDSVAKKVSLITGDLMKDTYS